VDLGVPELLIILALIVLLFGATKLPKLARSVGQAKKEFQAGAGETPSGKADSDKD
jgi:sec-independent protein translocase protein TatA